MSWDGWKVENPMVRDELWDNWESDDEYCANFDVQLDYCDLPEEKRDEFFEAVYDFANETAFALSVENYRKKDFMTLFGHVEDYEYIDFLTMLENYPEVKVY